MQALLSGRLASTSPDLTIEADCAAEAQDKISNGKYSAGTHQAKEGQIPCYDPGNMQYLGMLAADTAEQARACNWSLN